MQTREYSEKDLMDDSSRLANDLRQGRLTLRQAVGLTSREMAAVEGVAEHLRRSGSYEQAIAVYGLLATHDPLVAKYWERIGDIQARLGSHPLAMACFEVAALLEGRDAALNKKEIRCLDAIGQHALAEEFNAAYEAVRATTDRS